MLYTVKEGDSPTKIARTYGVSMDALLRANPLKPTTFVAGTRTWVSILPRETINVPVAGMVGATVQDAINAIIALTQAGSPCDAAFVSIVCDIQRALGVTVDGKYGSGTAAAAKAVYPAAPGACSPRPAWWAPVGQSNCTTATAPVPAPTVAPTVTPSTALAPAAVLVLATIDPCAQSNALVVCAAQKALGVTADGKYGSATATAASKYLGSSTPPACSPRPTWWAPVGQSNCVAKTVATTASTPAPVPGSTVTVPSAVAALATINPCLQVNVAIVYAAQKAIGVAQDGKYGTATAAAAQKLLPGAPAACSPRPSWWAPVGQNNAVPSTAAPAPAPATVTVSTAPGATPSTTPGGTTTPGMTTTTTATTATTTITAPTKKPLSTGAIVAGAVGVAALVGIAALAMSKKGTRGRRGARGKTTHRKTSHKKRKR